MQLSEIKAIFHKELQDIYPLEEIDSIFFRCIDHYLNLERFVLVMQPNYTITTIEEQPLFEALTRLKSNEPVQYILVQAYFMDLTLEVNEHTLIPRPETEELVQWILDDNKHIQNKGLNILDMGTGSGCIAIALAKEMTDAQVYAIDISEKALEIAQQNAIQNKTVVNFIQADMLDLDLNLYFEIIVSNPPYVRDMEKAEIHENVKAFEPETALFVPDDDALKFYKAIAHYAKKALKVGGALYLEINQYLSEPTKVLFEEAGFIEVELKKDIFGNYRMLRCKKS